MKRKKGASHVEVILSFVLFTSFIIFMFIVFKPLEVFSDSTNEVEILKSKILNDISTNLSVLYPIHIDSLIYNPEEPCFSMINPLEGALTLPLIVKDENKETIDASREGEIIHFENSGNFYNIFYSVELEEQELSTTTCFDLSYELGSEQYTVGLIRSYKVVSYSKLVALKNKYNQNYEQLKQEFGIEDDFYIVIRNSPEIEFILGKAEPSGVEIFVEDFSVSILKSNADLNHDIMSVQVWG